MAAGGGQVHAGQVPAAAAAVRGARRPARGRGLSPAAPRHGAGLHPAWCAMSLVFMI